MRKLLAIVASIILLGGSADAQARKASAADSLLIRRNVYRELFAGITLRPEQRTKAQLAIADADRQHRSRPSLPTCAATHDLINKITIHRDSILLGLMATAADSATFKRRAEGFIMGPCPPGHP